MDEARFFKDMGYRRECYTKREYPKIKVVGKTIQPLNSEMKIVIPTYMREDAKRLVYDQIPESLKSKTYLFTKEERVPFLRKRFPNANIIALPNETNGIADTRQRVMEYFENSKIWMIDDQCKLQKRSSDFRVTGWATGEEIEELYDWLSYLLDYYIEVGVSGRPGNNTVTEFSDVNSRVYACQALRTDMAKQINVKFSGMWEENKDIIFMEDFYFTLTLLSKGYPNIVVYDYVADSSHGNPGGNSVLRTPKNNDQAWEYLAKKFPSLVKLYKVDNGHGWSGDMNVSRWEGRVSWSKAFNSEKQRSLF